jgi:hypothetical protein
VQARAVSGTDTSGLFTGRATVFAQSIVPMLRHIVQSAHCDSRFRGMAATIMHVVCTDAANRALDGARGMLPSLSDALWCVLFSSIVCCPAPNFF